MSANSDTCFGAVRVGRLPPVNIPYLEQILCDEHRLPKPREIAKRVHFTNEQRERHRIWTLPPVDMTKEQLAEQRRRKDRERKKLARRKAQVETRGIYLASFANSINKTKPWLDQDPPVSRSTFFRRKAKVQAARPMRLGLSRYN